MNNGSYLPEFEKVVFKIFATNPTTSMPQLAKKLGKNLTTMKNWKKKFPAFKKAIEDGKKAFIAKPINKDIFRNHVSKLKLETLLRLLESQRTRIAKYKAGRKKFSFNNRTLTIDNAYLNCIDNIKKLL